MAGLGCSNTGSKPQAERDGRHRLVGGGRLEEALRGEGCIGGRSLFSDGGYCATAQASNLPSALGAPESSSRQGGTPSHTLTHSYIALMTRRHPLKDWSVHPDAEASFLAGHPLSLVGHQCLPESARAG